MMGPGSREDAMNRFACAAAAAVVLFAACAKGNKAIQKDSKVRMHYTLKIDGKVVDSSEGKEPLEFVQGAGQIIPGLEEKLTGMKTGEKKQVRVGPAKGYGPRRKDAIRALPRKAFGDKKLSIGDRVQGQSKGKVFQAVVLKIGKSRVTLDFNHPLAGKTLDFTIEIVEVL